TFTQELAWTRRHLPRLQRALANLPDMNGVRLACSMHLDIKMIPLVEGILAKGAAVFLTTCNPTTVQNDTVAHLVAQGAAADAWRDMPPDAHLAAVEKALAWEPTHLCEMGADLTARLHQRPDDLPIRAGLEATGSGINRLGGITPRYPIFNWDDLPVKEGLHNRHMVGLTAWHTFFQTTRLTLHEKQVLVVGYGLVGQGVAAAARAYGGMVTVAERDPARALMAKYDGWTVRPLPEFLPHADVVATATGAHHILGAADFVRLRDGAFLLNVGHEADELDIAALRAYPHERVLPFVEAFTVNGRTLYLLAGGSMLNLTAGGGDSLNAFDVTLAVLAAGIGHIVGDGAQAPPGVHMLPQATWLAAI
ncbi:MAG: adenosylhomocysteinase, partial [Anaerolineales bacterium]|nr:adenosylhomocysteinase [Anaerolineales bacterium]